MSFAGQQLSSHEKINRKRLIDQLFCPSCLLHFYGACISKSGVHAIAGCKLHRAPVVSAQFALHPRRKTSLPSVLIPPSCRADSGGCGCGGPVDSAGCGVSDVWLPRCAAIWRTHVEAKFLSIGVAGFKLDQDGRDPRNPLPSFLFLHSVCVRLVLMELCGSFQTATTASVSQTG